MYRVISPFRDLKNDEHHYAVGDVYPVEGYKPTKNPLNRVFIVEEPSEETAVSEPEPEPSEETSDKND